MWMQMWLLTASVLLSMQLAIADLMIIEGKTTPLTAYQVIGILGMF
jgi:hypothetical protein